MDEPTNHLDLASSESLAESLAGYDGTLVFVSHNRSFVRKLATRIWNVEGGSVETYPGTLDEYMDSCRRRQADADAVAAGKPQPGKAATVKAAPAAQPARPAASKPAAQAPRDEQKQRRQREHQARQNRAQEKKLASLVERLEQDIAKLEASQSERSAQLADPEVYADKARSQTLIEDFRAAQKELELLQSRWEKALTELETLRAAPDENAL